MSRVKDELRELFNCVLYFLITLIEVLGEVRKIFPRSSIAYNLHIFIKLFEELVVAEGSELGVC